jgi:hypothetical protein
VPTGKDFRAIALALPEAEERETWGHPTAPKRLARELEE